MRVALRALIRLFGLKITCNQDAAVKSISRPCFEVDDSRISNRRRLSGSFTKLLYQRRSIPQLRRNGSLSGIFGNCTNAGVVLIYRDREQFWNTPQQIVPVSPGIHSHQLPSNCEAIGEGVGLLQPLRVEVEKTEIRKRQGDIGKVGGRVLLS